MKLTVAQMRVLRAVESGAVRYHGRLGVKVYPERMSGARRGVVYKLERRGLIDRQHVRSWRGRYLAHLEGVWVLTAAGAAVLSGGSTPSE